LLMLADESIFVRIDGSKQEVIQEQASAMVVNAHGGLAKLRSKVTRGQALTVVNKRTSQKAKSRVVWTREANNGQNLVAFEFSHPTPSIWPVVVFPADWKQWDENLPQGEGGRGDNRTT
jgi:hypothetical protein